MKKMFEKLKEIIHRAIRNIAQSSKSRERLAVLICVPITLTSVILCAVLLYNNGKEKAREPEITEFYPQSEETFGNAAAYVTKDGDSLEYQSLGNGTCLVMGIGNYRGSELVIPEENALGERVIGIGNRAFEGCTSLVSVSIPKSVNNIGSGVFKNCPSLVLIAVDTENPKYSAAGGTLFSKDKTRLICCPAARIGNSYLLNPNVKIIEDYAFEGIKNISKVLYEKSTADFEKISIGAGNEEFCSLPITCNYSPAK
ncbi:MAG: leucine-rich repeat protein [Clostridia bacterium]|nr:leucine-rich repeat protein [Clostridia bacterium]